ncbi:right-handed parallel beta-helix repeat-containing protein [Microbacterium sp. OVT16B]|uniref:right-handed parallel beta-helix repeat-containing protein n=1 Tax=Microbacterium sp. OVT16B TaxID=2862682 RepID=UPI001CBEF8C2|nr:right-handed parallel beta-helix repeat-containing protein [Microbacterium sp. OVT16B]
MTSIPSRLRRARASHGILAFLVVITALAAMLTGTSRADAATTGTILTDTMDRTSASGWGSAPAGGAYTASASSVTSVSEGAASLEAPAAGRTGMVRWNATTAADVDLVTTASVPELPASSGVYLSTHVRDSGDRSYAARLRLLGDGRTELELVSFSGFTASVLSGKTIALGDAVGSGFSVEVVAVGTNPVQLRARAWATGETRPDWQVKASDSSATRITAAGGLAWSEYASTGGAVAPVLIQDVTATPGTLPDTGTGKGCADGDLACDQFDRTNGTGWGSADLGGAWTASGAAVLSVDGDAGVISSPAAGRSSTATLAAPVAADSRVTADIGIRALPTAGSGIYLSVANRIVGDSSYAVRLRVMPDGSSELQLVRLQKLVSAEVLASARLEGKVAAGDELRISFQTTGTATVTLSGKAWPVAGAEPAAWNVSATDASAAHVKDGGRIGIALYSASGGSTPQVAIESIAVRAAKAGTEQPTEPTEPTEPEVPTNPNPDGPFPRGDAGAAAPGSFSFSAPATAVHVARTGSDANSGTASQPMQTITAALRKVPSGGTIVVHKGSYHEEVLVPPQKRVTIQPAPGDEVWLDGAEAVTGWRAEGGVWVKDGWTVRLDASPTYTKGAPDGTSAGWQFVNPQYPMAAHPDQLWVGGVQLTEVATRAQVKAGTFYVDKSSSQLVMGTDPSGKPVEASTLTQALSIRSAGTVLRGIGVRRYATSVPQMGTVVIAAADVTVSDVTIRDNSTTGLYTWSPRSTFTRVSVLGNGLLGAGASTADGLRVNHLLSVGNNAQQFNRAPVSGAFKVTRSRDIEVKDSAFLDNLGQGPWFDESVYDITFTGNDVVGNTGNGLVFELSEKAVIADNIVSDNALNGIYIIDTGNVQIWNNTAVGNQRNIAIIQDKRRASDTSAAGHDPRQPNPDPTVPWITRNTVIVNNVVGDAGGNCLICVEDRSKEFTGSQLVARSDGNLYSRPAVTAPVWFGIWSRGSAGDPAVTNTLKAFSTATGQDTHSMLVEGGSVVDDEYQLVVPAAPAALAAAAPAVTSIAQTIPTAIAAETRLPSGAKLLGAQPR